MEVKLENENESECIEQRILKMRAEIVAIQKEIAEIRKESERRNCPRGMRVPIQILGRRENPLLQKKSDKIRGKQPKSNPA